MIITKGTLPGPLRAVVDAALGVQAANVMRRHLAYPLSETAGASCPASRHTTSWDTAVHIALSLGQDLRPSLDLHNVRLKGTLRGNGSSPRP